MFRAIRAKHTAVATREENQEASKAKRWVAELHTLAQPWIQALTRAVRIPALDRVAHLIQNAEEVHTHDTRAIVYVRFSLDGTRAVYVGETENWSRRQEQHFTGTVRHSREYHACSNKRNGEHAKYIAHRAARPHTWFTVPLAVCASKHEAMRFEKRLIRILKPKLNMEERNKASWKSQPTYKEEMKKLNRADRNRRRPQLPPWRDPLRSHLRLRGGDGVERQHGFSYFWRGDLGCVHRHFDLGGILRTSFSVGLAAIRRRTDCGCFTVTARRTVSTPLTEGPVAPLSCSRAAHGSLKRMILPRKTSSWT